MAEKYIFLQGESMGIARSLMKFQEPDSGSPGNA
jgi:hypothetical protein